MTDFLDQLSNLGIISSSSARALRGQAMSPPEVVAALHEQGALTDFQAEQLRTGRPRQLVIDQYVLLEKIGAGGMGQVFKAIHLPMDRIVALKVLHKKAALSAESTARFQREVQAAAKLTHPNIVTAFDAGTVDATHFLVMEFVDGPDLAKLLESGPLPPLQAIGFIRQAAQGLAYAHGQGVVHRDVKPANLLLGKQDTIKVLDLGIARVITPQLEGDATTEVELTQSGVLMGSVDYMAPEQAIDSKNADQRSDIYSLGCTLFHLLTGRQAFSGDTVVEKIIAHREQPAPLLAESRRALPSEIDPLLQQMLRKDPSQRLSSMADVRDALAALESALGQGTGATRPPEASRDGRPAMAPKAGLELEEAGVEEDENDEPAAENRRRLEAYINGCGKPDQFISMKEEHDIFRCGGTYGLAPDAVESILDQRCRENGWVRQTQLADDLMAMLHIATKKDGVIAQEEFEQVVDFAIERKMPRRSAEEICVTIVLDHHWRVKEGVFRPWFTRKRKQLGLE